MDSKHFFRNKLFFMHLHFHKISKKSFLLRYLNVEIITGMAQTPDQTNIKQTLPNTDCCTSKVSMDPKLDIVSILSSPWMLLNPHYHLHIPTSMFFKVGHKGTKDNFFFLNYVWLNVYACKSPKCQNVAISCNHMAQEK